MKRLLSVLLTAAVLLSVLPGCSLMPRKRTALTIGKAEIDNEVFAYFYDAAYTEAAKSEAGVKNTAAIEERAVELCCNYVGATTEFEKLAMKLNAESRKAISENSEECWRLYGRHYTKEGVSKTTVGKIETVKQYRTALLLYYFGEGSEYEVAEHDIADYFDHNYVEFQAIVGYLTTQDESGETIPLPDQEASELRELFVDKCDRMKKGDSLAQVNDDIEVSPTLTSIDNSAYPKGFLEKVSTLSYNEPTLIETEEYLFLVVRLDAKKDDPELYEEYRTRSIDSMIGADVLDPMLVATAQDFPLRRYDYVIDSTVKKVLSVRQK